MFLFGVKHCCTQHHKLLIKHTFLKAIIRYFCATPCVSLEYEIRLPMGFSFKMNPKEIITFLLSTLYHTLFRLESERMLRIQLTVDCKQKRPLSVCAQYLFTLLFAKEFLPDIVWFSLEVEVSVTIADTIFVLFRETKNFSQKIMYPHTVRYTG